MIQSKKADICLSCVIFGCLLLYRFIEPPVQWQILIRVVKSAQKQRRSDEYMNLKEAFRYQNKLQDLMEEAKDILSVDKNVTKVENTHLRHKINPDAED